MDRHEQFQAKLRQESEAGAKQIVHPFPTASMTYPRWPTAAFFLSLLVALILTVVLQTFWIWIVPAVVMVLLILQQRCFVRCPRCSHRLKVRTERVRIGPMQQEDRMFYDCPDCKVAWDPNIVAPVPNR
jgi:DNA-directed RNA polymerase subunit RPC12/RpoP